MKNKWILTDGDSFQHVRKLSEVSFELIAIHVINADATKFTVVAGVVDVGNAINNCKEELEKECLSFFGYKGIQDVEETYGDYYRQIIAECMFKTHMGVVDEDVEFSGPYLDCKEFISQYMKRADALNASSDFEPVAVGYWVSYLSQMSGKVSRNSRSSMCLTKEEALKDVEFIKGLPGTVCVWVDAIKRSDNKMLGTVYFDCFVDALGGRRVSSDMAPFNTMFDADAIKAAEGVLADNGAESDEASATLQAVGYALLNAELYEEEG